MANRFWSVLWAGLLLTLCAVAGAADISWDDGGFGPSAKHWSNIFNWNTTGIPGSNDNVFVGDLGAAANDATLVNQDFSIRDLTISNGASVNTTSRFLTTNGTVAIGLGSTLFVSEHANGIGTASFQHSGSIDLVNLSKMSMQGGFARVGGDITVNGGGTFEGWGDLRFNNGLNSALTIFTNDGILRTGRDSSAPAGERFSLLIRATDQDAFIDLDGTSNNGSVFIVENTTLQLAMSTRAVAGTMNFSSGAHLESSSDINISSAGVLNVDAGTGNAAARIAPRLATPTMNMDGTLNISSGMLEVGVPMQGATGGSINVDNNAGIQF